MQFHTKVKPRICYFRIFFVFLLCTISKVAILTRPYSFCIICISLHHLVDESLHQILFLVMFQCVLSCRNLFVMMLKFSAYLYTGSASMMSESIHSFADAANQVFLFSAESYDIFRSAGY